MLDVHGGVGDACNINAIVGLDHLDSSGDVTLGRDADLGLVDRGGHDAGGGDGGESGDDGSETHLDSLVWYVLRTIEENGLKKGRDGGRQR